MDCFNNLYFKHNMIFNLYMMTFYKENDVKSFEVYSHHL
ncbi:hypothetical protein J569_2478 [Acinetobacter sp. 907131]|nr:hypothetical protein J569_2478 [Acinetobacter sp. 907131]WHA52005.1 hypothetical protein OH685_01930 [Acinetobacter pittii]